ncbi:type II secretion system GspH family protein [Patescibacteria group bacterium]|nr:type II secretion system GspH family protein [Patescibacteria group bacterium]
MKKIRNKKNGFSIPEVIVAISIVTLVIVTATNLLVSSMRSNNHNVKQIIAYNLAQEAIEGLRNVRDGNWLHNQYFRGSDKALFGHDFSSETGYYIIDRKNSSFNPNGCTAFGKEINDASNVAAHAPWEITKMSSIDDDLAKMTVVQFGDINKYTHARIGEDSGFKRFLEIQTIPYELATGGTRDDLKIAVVAVVEWEENGQKKSVTVPTILTDWKAGPL